LEEIGDGDAWSVDEEFGGREVGVIEGGDPGEGLLASATFDLNGDQRVAAVEDGIDFQT
jgi:hypothetical protein